jgi:predicted PurR-regulated permease PerM
MVAIGLPAGLALILLGLADPLLLAVLAGLCEIIPMVGPFLSSLPALLVAMTVDPSRALLLIPIAVAIHQIEGNLLIPRIMSQAVW